MKIVVGKSGKYIFSKFMNFKVGGWIKVEYWNFLFKGYK